MLTTSVDAPLPSSPMPPIAAWNDGAEHGVPGDLAPWAVLPEQVIDDGRPLHFSGAKRLMVAILADAIQLYLKHRTSCTVSGRILFRQTEQWIESGDGSWLYSFENVCDVLGIDPRRLRCALRAHAAPLARLRSSVDTGRLSVAGKRKRHG